MKAWEFVRNILQYKVIIRNILHPTSYYIYKSLGNGYLKPAEEMLIITS